ncbi:MAG: PAS domain S-box protein [Candidatus Edwardsbacteria bacterium]|nr:PAS domain S-box protein [Candidatus Edwardsbacteria bacterium]
MDDQNKSREHLLKELSTLKVRLAETDVLEAELRRTRDKLRAMEQIVDSMRAGVTLSDIDGRILYTNPSEAAMHGYAVAELIGREVRIFAPNGIWNPLTRGQAKKLKRLTREGINVRKDGSAFRVLLTSDVVKNQQGEPVAIITTSEEITARKQAEEVMAAMFRISDRTNAAGDVRRLFDDVHNIVGGLIYARNFFIARYDEKSDALSFPHYADEFSAPPEPAPLKKGLIEQVLRTGEALFATQETLEKIIQEGAVDGMDTPFVNWLGVPIKRGDRTIGLLGIKSYTDDIQFTEIEKNLLFFLAQQISGALERTKAWDEA